MEEMSAGAAPKRDIVSHGEYQGIHRTRQVDIAKKLFGAMGIARDDKPMRQDWVLRGFRQFDAPVSLDADVLHHGVRGERRRREGEDRGREERQEVVRAGGHASGGI